MNDLSMIIHKTSIALGEEALVRIPVGRLPSGNQLQVYTHVFRSREAGPCMLVLAGIHGDEVNGIEIVRQAINGALFRQLQKGTVIAIPVLNVYGFISRSREVPDGKDVNRSFPGLRGGSLAARMAATLTKKILPLIDFGVDFHSGSRNLYNFPQIRFNPDDDQSQILARQFGAPVALAKKPPAKSLRHTASREGVPLLIFEGGESQRFDPFVIDKGLAGLRHLLAFHGMIDEENAVAGLPSMLSHSSWVRAARSGLFQWNKASGQPVNKGEILGLISDPHGGEQRAVTASRDGLIIGHNNSAVVNQGDALFHIGYQ